jgi:hypothetical protein
MFAFQSTRDDFVAHLQIDLDFFSADNYSSESCDANICVSARSLPGADKATSSRRRFIFVFLRTMGRN